MDSFFPILFWIMILVGIAAGRRKKAQQAEKNKNVPPPTFVSMEAEPEEDLFEEPAEVKSDPDHTHEGTHIPTGYYGEGAAPTKHFHQEKEADPCRTVTPEEPAAPLQATRKTGASRAAKMLRRDQLAETLLLSEVLNRRGGRRRTV